MATSKDVDELLAAIRVLPVPERLKLVERVVHDIAGADAPAPGRDPMSVIGSFSDIPDVIQDVCEAAMVARERDPLRLPHG
jgi:hypothetical protein